MALPTQTGVINPFTGSIEPQNTGDWTSLGDTWDNSATWNPTATEIVWISDPVVLESSQTINLVIETIASGSVDYQVISSDTAAFSGEETTVTINHGDVGVSAFNGQYFYIVATVTNDTALPTLENMSITVTQGRSTKLTLSDVDTSTLSGTTDARTIDFGRTVSGVRNIQITVKETSDFTLESYVTDYPTSNTLLPRIVDKTTPSIALVGLDNVPRDAVVDIIAEVLPEQYMSGNNLLLR